MSTPKTFVERDAIYLGALLERYAPVVAKYPWPYEVPENPPCCASCWWYHVGQWEELEVWKRAFPKLAWEVALPSGIDDLEDDS